MNLDVLEGVLIPFAGTSLGAACVFFMKKELSSRIKIILNGFAAGVMVAAAVWSLILPSLEQSVHMGRLSFIPAAVGIFLGILFLLLIDRLVPHLHVGSENAEGPNSKLKNTTMLVLAVTIHNIPEGMAVGVVYAGWLAGDSGISLAAALALSLGIAIQNFPEGAIISMPLCANGASKSKALLYGILSGAVEPVAAIITVLLSTFIIPVLPYLLCFAAGAMLYVVVEELIPEMSEENLADLGTVLFAIGFIVMMALDVALS